MQDVNNLLQTVPGCNAFVLRDLFSIEQKFISDKLVAFRFHLFLRSTLICIPDNLVIEIKNAFGCAEELENKYQHLNKIAVILKNAVQAVLQTPDCYRDNVLVDFSVKTKIVEQCDFSNSQSILNRPGFQQIFAFLDDSNWNLLSLLIGDKAMMKILTHCAIFYELTPSNYMQLCGFPLHRALFSKTEKCLQKVQVQNDLQKTCGKNLDSLSVEMPNVSPKHMLPDSTLCNNMIVCWTWILYQHPLEERFPIGHFLSKALPNDKFAGELALHIYNIDIHDTVKDVQELYQKHKKLGDYKLIHANSIKGPISYFSGACELSTEIKQMMKMHRRCHIGQIIKKYCPQKIYMQLQKLNQQDDGNASCEGSDQQCMDVKSLIKEWIDPNVVAQLLITIGKQVIPENLLGKRNKRIFLNNSRVVTQIGKTSVIRLGMIMKGITVDGIDWLLHIPTTEEKLLRLSQLILWLFAGYLLPLIEGFFHVTISNVDKNQVVFFQKCIWNHIEKDYLKAFIDQEIFKEICHISAMPQDRCVGYVKSKLRLLPTKSSLRPILLRMNSNKDATERFKLGDCLAILQGIVFHAPRLLGFAKHDMREAVQAWESFVLSYKEFYSNKPLYFVKVDISACYTSMLQDKIMSILGKVFNENGHLNLISYYQLKTLSCNGKTCKLYVSKCIPKNESFVQFMRKEKLGNSVLVPVRAKLVCAEREISYLRIVVKHNLILARNNFYLQQRGVSQGGVVSGILCDLYFGDMEMNCLSELFPQCGEFADRYRDDYLFITPDLERAKSFLEKMMNGFPDYNCTINIDKTLTNLNVECGSFPGLQTTKIIRWLGWRINTETLAVVTDYNWSQVSGFADNLLIDHLKGKDFIRHKLLSTLATNSDRVLFSAKINPLVDKNIYDAAYATACKLVALLTKINPSEGPNNDSQYYLDTILMCASVIINKINICNSGPLPFSSEEVIRIVLRAFLDKFSTCQSLTKSLIRQIKHIAKTDLSSNEIIGRLHYAADEQIM